MQEKLLEVVTNKKRIWKLFLTKSKLLSVSSAMILRHKNRNLECMPNPHTDSLITKHQPSERDQKTPSPEYLLNTPNICKCSQ